MKRLARSPLKFEAFSLFTVYGQNEVISIRDRSAVKGFEKMLGQQVDEAALNKAFVYGHLAEAIFGQLVAALDDVRLIKQEDAGEVYAKDDTIRIPDFRLILSDGTPVLVEVKNFHQKVGREPYEIGNRYLQGLEKYAQLMNCELLLAIYWVRWNMWTLVAPSTFSSKATYRSIGLGEAIKANQMIRVGDRFIGTRFPLKIRMLTDRSKDRSVRNGQVQFTIGSFELYCQDTRITDRLDRDIAYFFCMWGEWEEEQEAFITNDELDAIEWRWSPTEAEKEEGQDFSIVGSLSGMFSKRYRTLAVDDEGLLKQVRLDFPEGTLTRLFPREYRRGKDLPLWVFSLEPS